MSDEVKEMEFNLTPEELNEKYPVLTIPIQGGAAGNVILARNAHYAHFRLSGGANSAALPRSKWYEVQILRYHDEGSWTLDFPDLNKSVLSPDLIAELIAALRAAKEHIISHGG